MVTDFADLLTLDQAAVLLTVSKGTLQRWIKGGRLPAFRVGTRKLRLRRSDLAAMVTPVAGPGSVEPGAWTAVIEEAPFARPLTEEQAQQQLQAIREAEAFRELLLAEHGGVPFSSSVPLIRRARAIRSKQLLR